MAKPLQFTREQKARILAANPTEGGIEDDGVDSIDVLVAEMGMMYGIEMLDRIRRDEITTEEMMTLYKAGLKAKAKDYMELATAFFVAGVSFTPQPKGSNASSVFRSNIKSYEDRVRSNG